MLLSPTTLALRQGSPLHLQHVPFAAQAEVACSLARGHQRTVFLVALNERELVELEALCSFLAPEIPRLIFPAWDTLPYDRVSPSSFIIAQRIATLSELANAPNATRIVLTTLPAVTQYVPPHRQIRDAQFRIQRGATLYRDGLLQFLVHRGYHRVSKVSEAGEYAIRGSIIDIFPAAENRAYRIDTFGDDIESIRSFDPLTQITDSDEASLTLRCMSEVLLEPETIAQFRTRYREMFGAVTREDPLYTNISEGRSYAGMEHWLPFFYPALESLADYTPNALWCFDARCDGLFAERQEQILDYYEARKRYGEGRKDAVPYHPVPPEQLFMQPRDWEGFRRAIAYASCSPFQTDATSSRTLALPFEATISPSALKPAEASHILEGLKHWLAQHPQQITILALSSQGSRERILHMLAELSMYAQSIETLSLHKLPAGLYVAIAAIEHGYRNTHFTLFSEQEVLGTRIIRTQKKRKKSEAFLQEAASFAPNELVVHREHGIGQFESLITVEVNGNRHDCLKLLYEGGDRLFLPVENIDLISRFGEETEGVTLDKLGGVAWQKRKSALKKRLRMAADALIKIAAERATKKAEILAPQAGLYDEFCARFPYSETEDQLQAITDVQTDLTSGSAMDRLICGDVGFGKTEVALRAAFMAAACGKQVAVVAPTTLLARQHYYTFLERFRDLPYRVHMLSRLVYSKEAASTRSAIADGSAHIVIGTHALLADGIAFKQLGLLIVDEEQHFGVKQKEKLKNLKADIHVLTLSATPIPRTLQMALSGVRELSLITTPPIDRLAVRSSVMPFDPLVIREAILREHHRGGKTFYVTPRIKYMAELKQKLETLVPEVKVCAAHGQMPPSTLDRMMNEFYDGRFDVLLSTAIIESGIDIPTANTMIIDHPEMFGLAQLYQLRGRVGRSNTRAYCYFTLPHQKNLTATALRRLEIMQQLDSLGAGFALASHDMDMRGFGNMLGEEQSGHIREVGVELYQAMLEEAIAERKARRHPAQAEDSADTDWSPQINLGMSVLIPDSYVEDLSLRLSLYRRIAQFQEDAEIEGFAAELIDRFGALPQEVSHLLAIMRIKLLCRHAAIERLDAGEKGLIIGFRNNQFAAPEALLTRIHERTGQWKLRADQRVLILGELNTEAARIAFAQKVIAEIASLLPSAKSAEAA